MTLIASDGYEYEDIAQRLLGNPLKNDRNQTLKLVYAHARQTVDDWVRVYDATEGDHPIKRAATWRYLNAANENRRAANPR